MSERIQTLRMNAVAVVAAAVALAAVIANLLRSGKVLWGGVVVAVIALSILIRPAVRRP